MTTPSVPAFVLASLSQTAVNRVEIVVSPAIELRFREQPPDPPATGRERESQESAHRFYQDWTSGELPKMLVVLIQDPNPFYDDPYAVNSANVGPYGDAMVNELIQVFMGDTDTFYLEEATLLLEEFLESTKNPHYDGKFVWGPREGHCFTGAPKGESFIGHYLPEMVEHMRRTAPLGTDLLGFPR
jgi:hypothetical protein